MIGKTIGEGTFGKVKLGHHILTGERVAIKILEKDKIKDPGDAERVSREIKILRQVRHPNIVQLFEIIETPKQFYLIMEYANGGELFEFIVQHGKIKETLACKLFLQVLAGLEYLHILGISHRDLKPENLLLDDEMNLKIVDFGLSNTFRQGELLKTACGSPCYAAPEMIAGKKYDGGKSDIWSCGIILFALICGYLPFEDPNTATLYKKILIGEFKPAKWVSTEGKDLLKKILQVNPELRPSISEIRAHPWCNISSFRFLPRINMKVEENVMKMVAALGIDEAETKKHLDNKKHNHFTATYYLLAKKLMKKNLSFDRSSTPIARENDNRPVSTIGNTARERKEGNRRYSVTPPKGSTARAQIRPQEPSVPKPVGLVSSIRIYYLGNRLYMKNDKNKEFSKTIYKKHADKSVNQNDFSFG